MDIYLNLKSFQATAELGNFSRAARRLGLAASVVTKRVNQLEHQLGATLFRRSTRALILTEQGRRYLDQARTITAQLDQLLAKSAPGPAEIEDFVRIKASTTLTVLYLNRIFQDFQRLYPKIRLELVLVDRSTDPLGEGYDLAVGALPIAYGDTHDEPLCRLRRFLCASPEYLRQRGTPRHPRDLTRHDCLSFLPTGHNWSFESQRGVITVEVRPKFSSNDGRVLVDAAISGNGIAIVSSYLANREVQAGRLVPVLGEYPLPELWVKAIAPESRARAPAVRLLLDHLRAALTPVPPWERERDDDGDPVKAPTAP